MKSRNLNEILKSIKSKTKQQKPIQENQKLFQCGSNPERFCGTSKLHQIDSNNKINQLPTRPIDFHIGKVTYHLAKHLSTNLSPTRISEYTIKNEIHFLKNVQKEAIAKDYQMPSFEVKSLFTNGPLGKQLIAFLKAYTNMLETYM